MRRLFALLLSLVVCLSLCQPAMAVENTNSITYEIFVASFADSDGDGMGDLRGIIDRLDYLTSLHVKRIWLMPISPSPSYHKYDVTDYYAIDPAYGTLEDFDALVAACGEVGIDVIIDLVVNHTSSEHPWFKAACDALRNGTSSPYLDWYGFMQGSGQHPVEGTEDWYYEGQFVYTMPDLNLDHTEVRDEIKNIITFWQAHGVKGFRLDAVTSYYTGDTAKNTEFLRFITDVAHANDPECYVVGEAWTVQSNLLAMYESGIDSLFYFPGADQEGRLLKSAKNGKGAVCGEYFAEWNAALHAVSATAIDAPFLTNHDMARSAGMLRSDLDRMKAAAMLYLLLPGRPVVYYGEEIGMSGSGRDENKRMAMLWDGENPAANCFSPADCDQTQRLTEGVLQQETDAESLLTCYRAVTALRAMAPVLERGEMTALDANDRAVCFFRVDGDGSHVAVLVNAGTEDATVSLTMLNHPALLGQVGGATLTEKGISLPAVSCAILQLDE